MSNNVARLCLGGEDCAGFHTGFFCWGGEKKITQGYSLIKSLTPSNVHCD